MANIRFVQIAAGSGNAEGIYGLTKTGRVFRYSGNSWTPLVMSTVSDPEPGEAEPERKPGDQVP